MSSPGLCAPTEGIAEWSVKHGRHHSQWPER